MNLKQYYNKKVKIVSVDKVVFIGTVNDYFYPDDNENEKESIVIDTSDKRVIEFYEDDIQTIEILPE